ncbi:hypothetical protein L6250_00275 [Candidatus Parcubacteria bacterium]|nr:hypothetical protein [Patescibacteria group bacterium]MCG2688070.1 hypothetical protein [Candidatus Parcubacteria bacterium]
MIEISNLCGWEGAEKVLVYFEPELRKNLGSSVIVWPVTTGLAIVRKGKRFKHGYLIKLVVGPEKIQIRVEKLKQYGLDSKFTERTLKVARQTVKRLLTDHC